MFVNDGDVEQATTLRETVPRITEPSALGFLMGHLDSVKVTTDTALGDMTKHAAIVDRGLFVFSSHSSLDDWLTVLRRKLILPLDIDWPGQV